MSMAYHSLHILHGLHKNQLILSTQSILCMRCYGGCTRIAHESGKATYNPFMRQHDLYGKSILQKTSGDFRSDSLEREIFFGDGGSAKIDGIIGDSIAVEVESRVDKQIRGALMDLLLHPFSKKLLVILPVHMNNPSKTIKQCNFILGKFLPKKFFQIVLLKGHGDDRREKEDIKIVQKAINQLLNSE